MRNMFERVSDDGSRSQVFRTCGARRHQPPLDKTTDSVERTRLLELADDEQGVWRCHSAWECTEACPQNVFPAEAIMALRKEITIERFKKVFRR